MSIHPHDPRRSRLPDASEVLEARSPSRAVQEVGKSTRHIVENFIGTAAALGAFLAIVDRIYVPMTTYTTGIATITAIHSADYSSLNARVAVLESQQTAPRDHTDTVPGRRR